MKLWVVASLAMLLGPLSAGAQSLDDLNIQIHGYATQGFLYTTNNNILTTSSSDGSPAWSEAVVNITAQPSPQLRIGVQGRYFLLGDYGNTITLDWAQMEYKVNDKLGVRVGKVKTPVGLLNEVQDIDPSYLWSLLPQSIYPIGSRNSTLSHFGGVVFGTLRGRKQWGKLEYRAWGGESVLGADDGYFVVSKEQGMVYPNGLSEITMGGTLRWLLPVRGAMIGASYGHGNAAKPTISETITGYGTFPGTLASKASNKPQFFGKYEKNKVMVAAEYTRTPATGVITVPGLFTNPFSVDYRAWYAMASYKITDKLTAGIYDSQLVNRKAALGPARFSKAWAFSGRYDFNQFLYAKFEQQIFKGTEGSYDVTLNPGGLKPTTNFTILKVGVSF